MKTIRFLCFLLILERFAMTKQISNEDAKPIFDNLTSRIKK